MCKWKIPRTETRTDRVENKKTTHIGVIKEDIELCDVFDFMGGEIGTPYQQTRFMMGKKSRDIEDRKVHDVYMDAYQDYVPMKRKIVKAAKEMESTYSSTTA